MYSLKDFAFKKAFRMSRAAFQELLQLLCNVCKVRSEVDGFGNKKASYKFQWSFSLTEAGRVKVSEEMR
jgi:hypothetical protein